LPAFVSNLKTIQKIVGPSVKLLAVLKADAYGHGAETLAPLAVENNVFSIGVSSLEEGIALRENGITAPILLLGGIYPLDNFSVAMEFDLIPTVASLEAAHALDAISAKKGRRTAFHLKVDTGMGRIGVSPAAAKTLLEWVAQATHISLGGIYSHLACAEEDAAFSEEQLTLFRSVFDTAKKMGFKNFLAHIANSAAVSNIASHFDMVRPGLALYGVSPKTLPATVKIQPVLNWKTKLVFLKKVGMNTPISYGKTFITKRESEIATLPVGYADGVPRLISNRGHVLIRGMKCPVVGRVTMDHTMIDVTGVGAMVGDEVVLIGSQGAATLDAQEWARWAETNSYEILCGISKRVPRIYRGSYADR
jgi:alanine racemase